MNLPSYRNKKTEQLILDNNLPSIPPSQIELPILGLLKMLIKLQYLNLPFQKKFSYRYCLWGNTQKIYFNGQKSQLKITSTIEGVSKYFFDMNILCLEIVSVADCQPEYVQGQYNKVQDKTNIHACKKTLKTAKQLNNTISKNVVGWVYIPLRKYFISHFINSFNQNFAIMDLNKKKIGQIKLDFNISMFDQNTIDRLNQKNVQQKRILTENLQIIQHEDHNQEYERSNKKKVTINVQEKMVSINKDLRYNSLQNSIIDQRSQKKSYFSNASNRNYASINNLVQDKNEQQNNGQQRKYHANSQKTRQQPQPQHSNLSIIRMKYGSNFPSVELMKLKLDQVQYLQNNKNNIYDIENIKEAQQIKILLKDFVFISGKVTQSIEPLEVMYCKGNKTISKTSISMNNLIKNVKNNTISLNNVLLLNNIQIQNDRLIIQINQCRAEKTIKQLINLNTIDLKRKDNKKRCYQLKFNIIFDKKVQNIKIKQSQQPKENNKTVNSTQKIKKTKQIQSIINKVPSNPLNMIPQKQNGERDNKESYKLLINKITKESIIQQPQLVDHQEYIKKAFKYFQLLYNCQNEDCLEIINKLLTKNTKQSKSNNELIRIYAKLQQILDKQNEQKEANQLFQIVNSIFQCHFVQFYQCYKSYKQINEQYQNKLIKLTKVLSFYQHKQMQFVQSQQLFIQQKRQQNILISKNKAHQLKLNQQHDILRQINGIIQYIKKYRKSQVSFGLIQGHQLVQIIKQKLNQFYKDFNIQIFKYIYAFVSLFTKYQLTHVKLSEIQSYCQQKQTNINLNFGLMHRLFIQITNNQYLNEIDALKQQNQVSQLKNYALLKLFQKNQQLFKSEQFLDQTPIYPLIFEDLLSLDEIKSSMFISQKNQTHQDYQYNQQIKTEQSVNYTKLAKQKIERHKNRLITQQIQANKRLYTQQRHRLNTQEQKIIEFVNKQAFKKDQIKGNQQLFKEDVVQIQITRKNQFVQQQQVNYQQLIQHLQIQQEKDFILKQIPKTQYIKLNLKIISPNVSKRQQVFQSFEVQIFNQIKIQNDRQWKKLVQSNCQNSLFQNIIKNPNFDININKKPQLRLKVLNIGKSKKKSIQLALMTIKNSLHQYQYPIQCQQTQQILGIIQINIQQLNQYQQKQYQTHKQIQTKQKRINKNQPFKQITMININRFVSLDMFDDGQTNYRIVYQQSNNQNVFIRNTQIRNSQVSKVQCRAVQFTHLQPITIISIQQQTQHTIKVLKLRKQSSQNQNSYQSLKTKDNFVNNNRLSSTIINKNYKQQQISELLCQFSFKLIHNKTQQIKINTQNKWLISNKYRLDITIFNIKYENINTNQVQYINDQNKYILQINLNIEQEWDLRIKKIIKIFSTKNLNLIICQKKRYLYQLSLKTTYDQKFHYLLKQITKVMNFKRTQIDIFSQLIFGKHIIQQTQDNYRFKLQYLLKLFGIHNVSQQNNMEIDVLNLYQEFQTFDLQHQGFLTQVKGQVIKKAVEQLKAFNFHSYLLHSQSNQSFIRDLKSTKFRNRKIIDYIRILWDLRQNCHDNFFYNNRNVQLDKIKQQLKINEEQKYDHNLSKFYRISIKKFQSIHLQDNSPITLEIRLNKYKLFQPIYRCYSNIFNYPYPSDVIKVKNQLKLQIFNKLIKTNVSKTTTKNDLYEFKLIEQINLMTILKKLQNKRNPQLRVQTIIVKGENFQGTITFQAEQLQNEQQFINCKQVNNKFVNHKINNNHKTNDNNKINDNLKSLSIKQKILQKQFYQQISSQQNEQKPYKKIRPSRQKYSQQKLELISRKKLSQNKQELEKTIYQNILKQQILQDQLDKKFSRFVKNHTDTQSDSSQY